MSITTMDGCLAGMKPARAFQKISLSNAIIQHSSWGVAGVPGPGAYDTTLNGVVLSSSSAMVAGQIPHTDPGSGNSYLARLVATQTSYGMVMLLDRLWHNGGYTITSTSAQNSTTPTWPARDIAGSTNGDGVLLGVEVSSGVGAGTPTITVSYTNSSGTSGRTSSNLVATVASTPTSSFIFMTLQAGDTGVRSVQSLTLSATWTSGTINLVAYRFLAMMEIPFGSQGIDALTGGLVRLYNGVVPFLVMQANSSGAPNLTCRGHMIETQG